MPVRRATSRLTAPSLFTSTLCQAVWFDSTQARRVSATRYAGMLAPSHSSMPRSARRLSGGVVITTYAAATPATARTTFAAVRAEVAVTCGQLLRGPLEPEPVDPGPLLELPEPELPVPWLP